MNGGPLSELRREYHACLFERVLRTNDKGVPNNADASSRGSVEISRAIVERIGMTPTAGSIPGQTAGRRFEGICRDFIRNSFRLLHHLRPGEWEFTLGDNIQKFAQYRHLAGVRRIIQANPEMRAALGEYIVMPDVVIHRRPVGDETINAKADIVGDPGLAEHTPLRSANSEHPILHASISCKWTIRSDRSQNARTEGLNLIRNRKGASPHIAVVTAEPLPSRIGTLALGTGDIDCVYHFALPELQAAVEARESDRELLATLVDGGRLRDIADLPFDLAT